jgi:hypothetical protein
MKTYQVTVIRPSGTNVFSQKMPMAQVSLTIQANSEQEAYKKAESEVIGKRLIEFNGMEMVIIIDGKEHRDGRF